MKEMNLCLKILSYADSDSMAEVLSAVEPGMREAAVEAFLCMDEASVDMEDKMLKAATAFVKIADYPLAEKMLRHIEKHAKMWKNNELLLSVLSTIGTMYLEAKRFDRAREYTEAAFAQADDIGNRYIMERCAVNLGIIASEQSDYAVALQRFRLGSDIAQEIGDKNGTKLCRSNLQVTTSRLLIAIILATKKDKIREIVQSLLDYDIFEYASEYIAKTAHQCEYNNDAENYRRSILTFMVRVGQTLLDLSRYAEAHQIYNYAIPIAQFINAVRTQAELMLNLANLTFIVYGEEGADELYTALMEFCEKNDIPEIAVYGLISWGGMCENLGDREKAQVHYERAYAIAEANGLSDFSEMTKAQLTRLSQTTAEAESAAPFTLSVVEMSSHSQNKQPSTRQGIVSSESEAAQSKPETSSALVTRKDGQKADKADASIDSRHLCVFISSTFCDMHAERDLLLKRVFPKIRRLCAQRYVQFTGIDLRWGITDEQAANARIIPICLREIDRTRPYFICMLGDRYGSTYQITENHRTMLERYPWLAKVEGKSYTEIEIMYGVLNTPTKSRHAYFYFRKPRYISSVSEKAKTSISDSTLSSDGETSNIQELKNTIRQHSIIIPEQENAIGYMAHHAEKGSTVAPAYVSLRENYITPDQFADWIERDLIELVNFKYPENSDLSPLDIERLNHEMFARQHLGFHVRDDNLFAILDRFASRDGSPLVICGDTGSGKSALIINWVDCFKHREPPLAVIEYYVGATKNSIRPEFMLKYLIMELGRRFGFEIELPDTLDLLIHAFRDCLYNVSKLGSALVVIDGLSQLEEESYYSFLPPTLPPNIRLLLSVEPTCQMEEFRERNWFCVDMQQFDSHEMRNKLIDDYLALHSKAIGDKAKMRIINEPMSRNPLFLRVLLDELLLVGKHEKLDHMIDTYLEAKTLVELYDCVLARLERDYDEHTTGIIGKMMSLLALERYHGIAETEVLELITWPAPPVPRIAIEPFMNAAGSIITNRGGILLIANTPAWHAVGHRYMSYQVSKEIITQISDYRKTHPDAKQRKLHTYFEKLKNARNEGLDPADASVVINLGQTKISTISTKAIMDKFDSLKEEELAMRESGQILQLTVCLIKQIFHILGAANTRIGPILLPLELALEKVCETEAILNEINSTTNDTIIRGSLGTTLGLKGLVCSKLNLMKEALDANTESAEILRPLAQSNELTMALRDTLINKGNLLARMGKSDAADRCYDEAAHLGN